MEKTLKNEIIGTTALAIILSCLMVVVIAIIYLIEFWIDNLRLIIGLPICN